MDSKAKSLFKKKVGKHVKKHREDETRMGYVQIPGGINAGIAQLSDCKIGQYQKGTNEGEFYFSATGIVLSPDKNDEGVPVKGLRTSIMIGIHDHKKKNGEVWRTEEESVAQILNEIRKLGFDTSELEEDEIEEALEELKAAKPKFRFSTRATEVGGKTYVNENWNGAISDDSDDDGDDDDDIEDETEDEEEEEEEVTDVAEDEQEDEEVVPEKEEQYFMEIDGDWVEVEVTRVSKAKQTCSVVEVEDEDNKHTGVAWSSLKVEPE